MAAAEQLMQSLALACEDEEVGDLDELDRIAMLLYGLALESDAKAILVQRGAFSLGKRGKLSWGSTASRINGHDLVSLVRETQMDASAAEVRLMQRLTAFVQWAGRYPVPLEPEDYLLPSQVKSGPLPPLKLDENERDCLRILHRRLQREISYRGVRKA